MTDETQERMEIEGGDITHLGFGGQKINRHLELGDEFYLVIKCEVSSVWDKDSDGKVSHSAGCRTTILAEISVSEATKLAAAHA